MNKPSKQSPHANPALRTLPLAVTWGHLVDTLAEERGGLAQLARHLLDVAPESARLSPDPLTVERGLRRLRGHGHGEANKYGLLLIRCLGIPQAFQSWARELGQYHSRCSDLPVALRRDQLRLWNCPPISESSTALWIYLGLATIAHRQRDTEQRQQFMDLASYLEPHAEPSGRMEMALYRALLASDSGDTESARTKLHIADDIMDGMDEAESESRACYWARLQDQWAFLEARGWRQEPARLERALARYQSIPEQHVPFADFRRDHGRAWCLWRLGRPEALEVARQAADHAGDGGFIRFRVMSLNLQAHILGEQGAALRQRADRLAQRLGDEQLRQRLTQ